MKRLFLISIGVIFAATTQAALASDPTLRFEYNGTKVDTALNAPIGQPATLKLVVDNPAGYNISSVRAKINFDPSALTGVMLSDSSSAFTLAAPNENKVDINAGTIQIGRSSVGGPVSGTTLEITQITLTPQRSGARLDFANFSADGIGDTALYFTQGIDNAQLLKTKPQSLQFGTAITDTTNTSDPNPIIVDTGWSIGNVLDRPAPIKLKTEANGTTTVVWQLSQDPNVRGYKFYYSTQSGKYIRAKDLGYNNIAHLSNIPTGKRYYFAVTAYDNTGKESDYSDEVTAVIGQSGSESHPFSGDPRQLHSGSLATSAGSQLGANTMYQAHTTPANTYQKAQQTTDSGPAEWLAVIAIVIGGLFTVTGIRRLKS